MSFPGLPALLHGRCASGGRLLGGSTWLRRGAMKSLRSPPLYEVCPRCGGCRVPCRMFSYRHAFHAGNHADVLKHTAWIALLRYLIQKDAALAVIDTHAGAGVYRLDGEQALTSGEAADGIGRLLALPADAAATMAPALADYLEVVRGFNRSRISVYPGSPFIAQRLVRGHDRLKLFELHPTDARALDRHVADLRAGRQVAVLREDGFEHLKKFLPPPSRRALVLIDPSYEIKTDYARVQTLMADALKRADASIIGLLEPPGSIASGQILLEGQRIDNLNNDQMRSILGRKIGAIYQDPLTSLNPLYSVGKQLTETIQAHLPVSDQEALQRAIALLQDTGIPAAAERIDHYPHQFSGGMRQRVVIALALAAEPQLIVADEPTTALDVSIQAQIISLLKNVCKKRGAAVMLITHDMGVIAETCDRVAVMYAGRIAEIGPVHQVINHPE
ncbi:MAG: 23S rRNA (adenine(2030)-N(6))-methyltransferase RlmJ, partial [Burkholderiaceae bacterium]